MKKAGIIQPPSIFQKDSIESFKREMRQNKIVDDKTRQILD